MANRRTLLAAAAIVLAVAASLGVYLYVSGADKRAEDKVQLVDAYVASSDIPKGTTGDTALADGLLTPAKVLKGSVPPSAVTDASQLKGKVASSTISMRQYITTSSFVAPSAGRRRFARRRDRREGPGRGDDLGRRPARRRQPDRPG